MTTRNLIAPRLLGTLLCTALSFAAAACGDDGETKAPPVLGDASSPATTPDTGAAPADSGASTGDAGANPSAAAACESKVYSELSDSCSSCACGVDPVLAPSCQKPCWDFLACSFAAQAGKCAAAAAGGAATRPEFEACTMAECGAQLAVPGAEVVSSYRSIIGACAVPMAGAKAACGDDIAKFSAALKKP